VCGLAGIAFRDPDRTPDAGVLRRMGDALGHRGPDDAAETAGPGFGIASRRLAILDLSPAGRMPMSTPDGRVVLAHNGEIYNHVELREDLKRRGLRLRSGSDTEVLLQLYLLEGISCLHRLAGMFAFAVWDARRRALILARDRLGVKPLVYRLAADGLRFASEAGGLLAEPGFAPDPDPLAIHHFLALRYVPRPATAWAGIRQLPPAHVLVYENGQTTLTRYWSIPGPAERPARRAGEREERHRALMDEAVRIRLRSDVPVAVLLSGGIDSAAVAYHIRRNHAGAFRAFTIGFRESDYDERRRARDTARHFGIELREIEVRERAADLLESIVGHMKVPFADPSAVPAWILAREVARHVKVALTGDGGDELFGGYDRYRAHLLADRFGWLPGIVSRTPFYALLQAVSSESSRRNLPGRLRRFLEGWELPARERNALWLANPGARRISRLYAPEFAARVAGADPIRALGRIANAWGSPDLVPALLRADQEHYLPDDLLFKTDATSMAFGLEIRSPFLDHRVVEFAATVPARDKVGALRGKRLLRRAYKGRLPESVLLARKRGFGMPIDRWFRGDLHGAARDLLLGPQARSRGYLNRDAVAAVLRIHHSGQRNYDEMIWTLLVLELWLRRHVSPAARRAA
jgi:asparagine synthase (glutamine-hydrolysing)